MKLKNNAKFLMTKIRSEMFSESEIDEGMHINCSVGYLLSVEMFWLEIAFTFGNLWMDLHEMLDI